MPDSMIEAGISGTSGRLVGSNLSILPPLSAHCVGFLWLYRASRYLSAVRIQSSAETVREELHKTRFDHARHCGRVVSCFYALSRFAHLQHLIYALSRFALLERLLLCAIALRLSA